MLFKAQLGKTRTSRDKNLPAPVKGLNAAVSLMGMPPTTAVVLENFIPFPDRLETRPGYVEHVTGFTATPYRLIPYANGAGAATLFATTDAGVYDVTTAGAVPAASIAITNGKVSSAVLSTGANTYLMLVNGADTLKQYDGAAWTSVATYSGGAVSTAIFSVVEVYKQRLFFAQKQSLNLYYLPTNSISGTATSYALGAIFRKGGYIVSIATWTLDSGSGPDDQLAVATSEGEIAVFTGTDPSSLSTWGLKGVYYIGKPLGAQALFKYGGDLLFLSENGLYPLSSAVQSAAIERVQQVTDKIRQLFNDAAVEFSSNEGWQVIAQPNIPFLLVNVPSSPVRTQFIMHAQTGAWAKFTGWDAYTFGRLGSTLYFATSTTVMRVTGVADNGANITATAVAAYNRFDSAKTKQILEVRPYLRTTANFEYSLGVISDLQQLNEVTELAQSSLGAASLWGSGVWGTAIWGGAATTLNDWNTVPDGFTTYKALYLSVRSKTATIEWFGTDFILQDGGPF